MGKAHISTEEAVQEVRKLINELSELNTVIGKVSKADGKSFNALKTQIQGLRNAISNIDGKIKTLNSALSKNTTQLKGNTVAVKSNTTAVNTLTPAIEKSTTAQTKNTRSIVKATRSTKQLFTGIRSLAGALGYGGLAAIIVQTIRSIVNLTIQFQSLNYALEQTSQSLFETGRSWQFLTELNDKYGASLISTTQRWLKFRTAARQSGLTLLETKNIFESVTKASAVLGLRTDELTGVYLALEQMLSKGKVTTEELRRQLGERLPGAMGIMAQAMGVTIPQLDKMMKKGEVLSAEVLPKFADELEKAYGIESLESVENLSVAIGKLEGQWQQLVRAISEGDSVLSKTIGGLLAFAEKYLEVLTQLFESSQQKATRISGLYSKEVTAELKKAAEEVVQANKKFSGSLDDINSRMQKARKAMGQLTEEGKQGSKEYKKQETILSGLRDEYYKLEKAIGEVMKLQASARIEEETKILENAKKDFIEAGGNDADLLSSLQAAFSASGLGVVVNTIDAVEKLGDTSEETYQKIIGSLSYVERRYFKQIELVAQLRELVESGVSVTPLDIGGSSGSERAIKYAVEFTETNRLLIAQLKERIKINKQLSEVEHSGGRQREELLTSTINSLALVAFYEKQDRDNAIADAEEKEIAKWRAVLSRFDEGSERYKKQHEQYLIAVKAAKDKADEEYLLSEQKYQSDINTVNEFARVEQLRNIEKDFALRKIILDKERDEALRNQQDVIEATAEGSSNEVEALRELERIRIKFFNKEISRQIALLKAKKALANTDSERAAFDALIKSLENTIETYDSLEDNLYTGEGAWQNWAKEAIKAISAISDLASVIFDRRIAEIDAEIAKEEEKYDRLIELAQNDEAERAALERNKEARIKQLEEKRKKERQKQAKIEKAAALAQAAINGALAVSFALATPPPTNLILAKIVGTLAAIELATIALQPIPQFAEGVDNLLKDTLGLINDGGAQEYIERGGKILTTEKENAVVPLKKGDTIYKNFEDMARRSMLVNLYTDGKQLSNNDYTSLLDKVEGSIYNGFKKSKINNKISILNEYNPYRDEMSYWN